MCMKCMSIIMGEKYVQAEYHYTVISSMFREGMHFDEAHPVADLEGDATGVCPPPPQKKKKKKKKKNQICLFKSHFVSECLKKHVRLK